MNRPSKFDIMRRNRDNFYAATRSARLRDKIDRAELDELREFRVRQAAEIDSMLQTNFASEAPQRVVGRVDGPLVCDAGGGEGASSDAHEIKQGQWYTSVALCSDCHTGARNGLHGQRFMWNLMKMDELDALAITIRRVLRLMLPAGGSRR